MTTIGIPGSTRSIQTKTFGLCAEHLQSLKKYPPRQAADSLSMHEALEAAMEKLANPNAGQ